MKKIQSINQELSLHGGPILISGPCSAETEEQLITTCQQLADTKKVDVLRAGIWKPRTKPGSFEGVGSEGLKWLAEAKKETGLKTAVEVANVKHVYSALKHNVDVLWLGARTTVNPFAVQEIADALQGVDTIVLLKNPVNPDIALWEGGIERILKAGVTKVGAIHRGFSKYGASTFRNPPQWQIPIELKQRFPELTLICDPSHICGKRDNLYEIAQEAIDLNFDGIMLESHINPDKAWSDASQQITPDELKKLIERIEIREAKIPESKKDVELDILRQKINILDSELIDILSKRMEITDDIGLYKKKNRIKILQSNRWEEIMNKSIQDGTARGLSKEFIVKFLSTIHLESINRQNNIMNSNEWLNKILKKI
ncbi:MAG: bifunctional 3-deoxy-7-phosphoheptulonate synthase/chorismate mutase type II [Flavobacteriales bacterium]|nr:bifunctional 3-deoxy-7-phosphoheptulonate synthase/chorismate mutase type II [Flavobacteriales bacterium]